MASTWSSGETLPPSFNNAMIMDEKFSFVDFLPECQDSGGIFSKPDFANFRTLIDKANDWLRTNPRWEVITCESVEFKTRQDNVNYQKMVYMEYGKYSTLYVRGLRLWVREKEFEKPQQIGYFNLVPDEVNESGGIFSFPDFESLDNVIIKFNSMMHSCPVPGRIITIETQEMKISRGLDPDRSCWTERGERERRFLFVMRIFFEFSDGATENIGIMDFVPNSISSGGIFSLPQFEPFSNVVEKASVWSRNQQGIRICNLQSVEMKVKSGGEVDTQKMSYTEHGGRSTFYVRILRLAYTKVRDVSNSSSMNLSRLTCRTFVPVQLTSGFFIPEFESLHATKERVRAWIRATGAKVISAETASLRMYTGGEARHGTEATFTYNQTKRNEYWIFVIRIYINGCPSEPPAEMLPPVQEIEEQGCCTMS